MITENFRYPTPEEILALERAARRARAQAVARLLHDAFRAFAELLGRGLPAKAGARIRERTSPSGISPAKERLMAESFWKSAAASLPPQVRWRYARLFEAAEQFEQMLDFILTARERAQRALARAFHGLAGTLRNAARALDAAAWRLRLTR